MAGFFEDVVTSVTGKDASPGGFIDHLTGPDNPLAWTVPIVPLANMAWHNSQKSDTPEMKQAGAPPDRGATTQAALQAQLNDEVRMRSSQTSFGGGGGGLLDNSNQPRTASRVLLGS